MFCFHGLLILKMKCNHIAVAVLPHFVIYENLQFGRKQGFMVWTYGEVIESHWAESYDAIFVWADRVLVKNKSFEEKTRAGIMLPTTAQAKPQGGVVVAVGTGITIGKTKEGISVQVGAPVMYSK
ncbi:putative GroES-like superfamily, groES chaperonin family, groES chaperonin superfamily [Dioscorea sansibarensis]